MLRSIAEYDVALSYAGEDREYVEAVAMLLKNLGIRVFYDRFERADLWGKDLYQHLSDVYRNRADYSVIFASESYAKKLWARHELSSAQARAFLESREYILPARFDNTEIPGVLPTQGYIDLSNLTPGDFVRIIVEKLGRSETIGFDLVMVEQQARRRRSEDELWRNAHDLTFLVRSGRRVEIEIGHSTTAESKNVLELAFMFAHLLPAYGSTDKAVREFITREQLTWITAECHSWGTKWIIDGRKLLLFLPKLSFLSWIADTFVVPPLWHSSPRSRSNDPANSSGISFDLFEP